MTWRRLTFQHNGSILPQPLVRPLEQGGPDIGVCRRDDCNPSFLQVVASLAASVGRLQRATESVGDERVDRRR